MRSSIAQYLNEIVSLTIMALMCIALIAGQAGATPQPADVDTIEAVRAEAPRAPSIVKPLENRLLVLNWPKVEVDINLRFRQTGD